MFRRPITLDSLVRQLTLALLAVGAVLLVRHLSAVLLPFVVAWLVAYMLYPLVRLLQYHCRLRSRILSIVAALALVTAAVAAVLAVALPPTVAQLGRLGALAVDLARQWLGDTNAPHVLHSLVEKWQDNNRLIELAQTDEVQRALTLALTYAWNFVCGTLGLVVSLFGLVIVFLYIFFILLDYENVSEGWLRLVPSGHRPFVRQLAGDVERGMNSYFRGQSLIAGVVGILFAAGFTLIGLPLGIGLGLLIGVLNLVPYLQIVGIAPAVLCCLLQSAESGQSLWVCLLRCAAVFVAVQLVQDLYLTPRIMGKAMGLKPAVILLSLSVWGALLGFVGLIVALPLTTLCLSYYRRYVLLE